MIFNFAVLPFRLHTLQTNFRENLEAVLPFYEDFLLAFKSFFCSCDLTSYKILFSNYRKISRQVISKLGCLEMQ